MCIIVFPLTAVQQVHAHTYRHRHTDTDTHAHIQTQTHRHRHTFTHILRGRQLIIEKTHKGEVIVVRTNKYIFTVVRYIILRPSCDIYISPRDTLNILTDNDNKTTHR